MFNLGMQELAIIFVVALLIFGPSKLPELGKSVGKAIGEFKKASTDIQKEITEAVKDTENK